MTRASAATITATLAVTGGGSLVNQTLSETAADSRVYANAGGTLQITVRTGGELLDAWSLDDLYAVATASTLGVTGPPVPVRGLGFVGAPFHKEAVGHPRVFQYL